MDRVSQTMRLKDGRILGFAQYGDPKGKPLFFFHGWPSSRLAAAKYDGLAKKLHIRLIAPDRPGYGASDYQKDRTLLDWPGDVVTLADHLRINKFAVMGVSGGGPYAAACAHTISGRICKTGIVVGLSPITGNYMLDGLMWPAKLGWANFGKHAWVRSASAFIQYMNARISLRFHRFLFGSVSDKKLYADRAYRQAVVRSFREAFRQGFAGPELDLKLYTTDWGFNVGDIQSKTYLWYGADDRNVSLAMAKYYASHIRGSKLKIYPGEGHLIFVTHAEEILKTLTAI